MNSKELNERIGNNVRIYRRIARLSREKLSCLIDISSSYLGKLERGECSFKIDTLYKISEILNISVCDLLVFDNINPNFDFDIKRRIRAAVEKVPENEMKYFVELVEVICKNLA